jgi:hypothetical protein
VRVGTFKNSPPSPIGGRIDTKNDADLSQCCRYRVCRHETREHTLDDDICEIVVNVIHTNTNTKYAHAHTQTNLVSKFDERDINKGGNDHLIKQRFQNMEIHRK